MYSLYTQNYTKRKVKIMDKFAEDVFNTMMGFLIPSARVPGVENLFTKGSCADQKYEELYDACDHLCRRLGIEAEDDRDCETIKDAVLSLLETTGIYMFKKGYEFGQKGIFEYISFGRRDE